MIPGVNDVDIQKFAEIINLLGNGIKGIELLKYNHLAEGKYAVTGKTYIRFANEAQSNETARELCMCLQKNISDSIKVFFVK